MRHTIQAEGFGVRLRPVRLQDAEFIVWLRNLEHAKGRVGDSPTEKATQAEWLQAYFGREGDYYFIIETTDGIEVGAYGIYDRTGDSAESGRWVIRPEVPAAIPSARKARDHRTPSRSRGASGSRSPRRRSRSTGSSRGRRTARCRRRLRSRKTTRTRW